MLIDYLMCTCGQLYYLDGGQANGSIMKPRITYVMENGVCVETINRPVISHGLMCREGLLGYCRSFEDYKYMVRNLEPMQNLPKRCNKKKRK